MKNFFILILLCLCLSTSPFVFSGCKQPPSQNGEIVLPDDENNVDNENQDDDKQENNTELVDKVLKTKCTEIVDILLESSYFENEKSFKILKNGLGGKIVCQMQSLTLEEFGILNAFLLSRLNNFNDYIIKTFIEQNQFIVTINYK